MSIIHSSTGDHTPVSGNDTMTDWLQLISAEYRELPDLCLTKAQVRRLWNLDGITSEAVLESLEASGFLRRTRTGAYIRAGA
jgi:2-iminoacetate synthase ThiH